MLRGGGGGGGVVSETVWVEILEPESNKPLFANVLTGECLFEPPAHTN